MSIHEFNSNQNMSSRPESKTAKLVGQQRLLLEQRRTMLEQRRASLEPLTCFLCKGYLIDATTIDECMDSFCKSCIITHLSNNNRCPKCGTLIHKTDPLSTIHSDKVLQDIVYKLVPGLYDDEMKRRRDFYRRLYGGASGGSSSDDDDDDGGSPSSFTGWGSSNSSNEQYGIVSYPKPFYKPTDDIDLSIEPQTRDNSSTVYYDNKRQSIVTCFTDNFQRLAPITGFSPVDSQQFKTYLRCPAKLTVLQLKKFIAAKFNICKDDTIHLLYLNESLEDVYSLIDIAYIFDWKGIEHMRLLYRIERDSSRAKKGEHQPEGHLRKSKPRQSVGTSTQTVKRVCIDPKPKFYEEQNNNKVVNVAPHSSGRNMRPRNDIYSSKVINSNNQTPILRTSSSTVDCGTQSTSEIANDVTSKEFVALVNGGIDQRGRDEDSPRRSSISRAVTSAIKELSRLEQDTPNESRTLRKQSNTSSSIPLPRVIFNFNAPDRKSDFGDRSAIVRNRNEPTHGYQKEVMAKQDNMVSNNNIQGNSNNNSGSNNRNNNNNNDIRQLVPYVRGGYPTIASTLAGPSQSSLVTLASFTEARSNHMIAVTSNSTPTVSSSTAVTNTNRGTNKNEVGMNDNKGAQLFNQVKGPTGGSKQLVSFVTERGFAIVRCGAAPASSNAQSSSKQQVLPPTQNMANRTIQSQVRNSSSSTHPYTAGTINQPLPSGANSTHNISTGLDGGSGRHHLKKKPVYKTFVDPTKLKSPNFKKFGYTARH